MPRKNKRGANRKKVVVPAGGWQSPAKKTAQPPKVSAEKVAVPLDINHDEVRSRRLVWRFADVDRDGEWDPAAVSPAEMTNLLEKMASYESMTIGEIFSPGSEYGKKYDVTALPSHALKRLTEIQRDDEAEIARLRCGGAPRLFGFLREHVFHVLWWDPKHTVWPSTKR